MEQFCKTLNLGLDTSSTCLSWFYQANGHCKGILRRNLDPGARFWDAFKGLIFPDRGTALMSQKIPISAHPQRLSLADCTSLYIDIVDDYTVRVPRCSIETQTNLEFWKLLYTFMGVMAICTMLVSIILTYRKLSRSRPRKETPLQQVFAPLNRATAYISHSMRVMKHEVQRLHVRHLVQPEELMAPDGSATLVMKVSSKLEFLNGIISSDATCVARMYRMCELMGKPIPDYKMDTLPRVMNFVNRFSRKLRVLFVFEDNPKYEDMMRRRAAKRQSPPKHSPRKFSPTKSSPRKCSPPNSTPRKCSTPNSTPSKCSTPNSTPRKCSTPNSSARKCSTANSTPRKCSTPNSSARKCSTANSTPRKFSPHKPSPPTFASLSRSVTPPTMVTAAPMGRSTPSPGIKSPPPKPKFTRMATQIPSSSLRRPNNKYGLKKKSSRGKI